jgi:hypothetical protein
MVVPHYSYTGGPPSAADLAGLCTGLNNAYLGQQEGLVATQTILHEIRATDLKGDTGAEAVVPTTKPGTAVGNQQGAQVAFVLKLHVAHRYRGGHPRAYFPGGPDDQRQDSQNWTAGYVTNAANYWGAFLGAPVNQTYGQTSITNQVAISYYSGHQLRPTPLIMPIVTRSGLARLGTQRRRLRN